MIRWIIFAIASAGAIWLSRKSLLNPRSHGFYRFLAFESILGLFLLNVVFWLRNPFSATQIVSWLMLIASLFLVVHGFYLLRQIGKPDGAIENTTILVTRGAYKYIRHPLYSSLLWLAWGIFFKAPSWLGGALTLVATTALFATARVEEAENLRKFGDEYAAYIEATKMFIPLLF